MTLPTIHLNGSGAASLLRQYEAAHDAIGVAQRALADLDVNGRDYYPQGPQAVQQAIAEHQARLQKLAEIDVDLIEIITHIEANS